MLTIKYIRLLSIVKLCYIITVFCGLFFYQPASAQPISTLDPREAKIKQVVVTHQSEQLFLLEKLVNVNSGTDNLTGVHHVGEILRPHFEQLGFKTRWFEEPKYMQRAGTFIAEHQGSKGKKLLLIGHLDTVFPQTSHFQKFYKRGNIATGPGVIDDKGGDVVILYALKALHEVGALEDASITVILTGDEENSGKPTTISRKPLFDAAKKSDVALDFEWSFTSDTATIARRGISNWTVKTQGQEVHSSQIFQKTAGYGAIFELARILNSMRTQLSGEKDLSFSPGFILGGTTLSYEDKNSQGHVFGKINVVAKTAMAKGDLRFLTPQQKISIEKKITSIISQSLPGTSATITFQDGIPSMQAKSTNRELLEKYSQASIDLGYGPVQARDLGLRGAADISHIASIVQANLAGLGLVGTGAHSEKETVDIQSIPMQTQRAAILMHRLIHSKEDPQ
jgi:glutamate carboxypeptidase